VIDDTINVETRLQSTGIPGQIHISQHPYELVQEMGSDIEYREEIELKWKGKNTTYTVKLSHDVQKNTLFTIRFR
jgi:class 3 adenylate cyclase